MRTTALHGLFACLVLASALVAAPLPPALLGASYPDHDGYAHAEAHLARLWRAGFRLVSFVPGHAYVGLDRIDFTRSPDPARFEAALTLALARGFTVVVKPHLEPGMYKGIDPATTDNMSWRVGCPWRGFFDVDPLCHDYADGVVRATLQSIARALAAARRTRRHRAPFPPVRFELGTELMNSLVAKPDRWLGLARLARQELARLGLERAVLLSHNVAHHFMIPEDEVLRMSADQRRVLGRYIASLDALAISQYMDLTIADPLAKRGHLPEPGQIAEALIRHEHTLIEGILMGQLGLTQAEIPAIHVGEFGIGSGGLKHPNLWDGNPTGAARTRLHQEIEQGFRGLVAYLERPDRRARSAVLWVTGRHFDIFGWVEPSFAIPKAAAVVSAALGKS